MNRIIGEKMGRFNVEVELSNFRDVDDARHGRLDPAKIRRMKLEGLVDPGATRLVLPEKALKQLGLEATDKIKVTYADRRSVTRPVVEGVYLTVQGRHGTFNATVGPKRETALIGAIVLEDLDFLVDCKKQRLVPRDPDIVISEEE